VIETPDNVAAIARWAVMPEELIRKHENDGDFAKRNLINPHLLAELGDLTGVSVLDAGAGDGYLSRILARAGATVTAVEPAQALVDRIRERERTEQLGLTIHQAGLLEYEPEQAFDVVVCSMVLMAIPDWRPALESCVRSLRPGGRLVINLVHPAFENLWTTWRENDGAYRVDRYLSEYELPGPLASDFHRPLSAYLNAIMEAGCLLRKVIEPGLDAKVAAESGTEGIEAYVELPNFVIIFAERAA
jgi:2-polyprenyl-3-methyl-5-hydroxy-6-metoxy-1,4-benzoquinol methylase